MLALSARNSLKTQPLLDSRMNLHKIHIFLTCLWCQKLLGGLSRANGYCGNIYFLHTHFICWIWPKWESCIGWLTDVESCLLSLTVRRSRQHSGDGGLGLCRLPCPLACRLEEEEGAQFYTQQQQSTGQRQTAAPDSAPRHRWDKQFSWVST